MGFWDEFRRNLEAHQQAKPPHGQGDGLPDSQVPEFPVITLEILNRIPDQGLVSALAKSTLSCLALNIDDDWMRQLKEVSLAKQTIFSIWVMDHVVMRDGWEKFQARFRLDFISTIPAALQMVGARQHESLVNDVIQKLHAFAAFDFRLPRSDYNLYLMMQGVDRDYDHLRQEEDLDALSVEFIRRNPEAFVDR